MKRSALAFLLLGALTACTVFARAQSTAAKSQDAANKNANYSVRTVSLPDNNAGDISMDYIAYDAGSNSVWVPAGNTGAVDVVDVATGKVRQISGFPTKEVEGRAGKRVVGPSGVSVGEGVVYIGSCGDSSVCAVNSSSLEKGACAHLDSAPDGVAYVAPTPCLTPCARQSSRR